MSRHSKNLASYFTSGERQKLKYGTEKVRLGKDSLRNYNVCFICLSEAREPMICDEGHLSCKGCILESIVNQKESISKYERALLLQKKSQSEDKERSKLEAEQLLLNEFSMSQKLSELTKRGSTTAGTDLDSPSASDSKRIKIDPKGLSLNPTSSTFTKSDSDFLMAAKQRLAEEEANRSKGKPALPSFWIPSLAPEEKTLLLKEEKRRVVCLAAEPHHPLSLKKLTQVTFIKDDNGKNVCKGCVKELSNSMKMIVSRKCGHVMCWKCFETLSPDACLICSCKIKAPKDCIEIKHEGTGFALKGKVEAQIYTPAFQ